LREPPNDELQRTSDGNAAGSPLNSVFGRRYGVATGGLTTLRLALLGRGRSRLAEARGRVGLSLRDDELPEQTWEKQILAHVSGLSS
jgi:hypothetical protein